MVLKLKLVTKHLIRACLLQMRQTVNPVREENFLQGVQNAKHKIEDNLLQMSLNIKSEVDENLDLKLANPNFPSPTNTSKKYCTNTPVEKSQSVPCLLPPIVQALSSDKSSPIPCIPLFASGLNSPESKPYPVNPPLTPVYILPYPWFVPVPYHHDGDSHHDPSAAENGKYNIFTEGVSPNSGTTESRHSTFTLQAKAEESNSKETEPGSNRTPLLHMSNGNGVFEGHATENLQALSLNNLSDPANMLSTGKHEPWFVQDSSQLQSRSLCSASQMNTDPTFFFPIKITEHVVAAAEARKRRKELTKFKNFTGRQYRLPC